MKNGWIKLHRKIIDWEWYLDANVFRVFLHILLKANHQDNKWRGVIIKSGQIITSRGHLAEELRIGEQSIRTSLNKLKSTNELTIKTTNKYTIITVLNWNDYQKLTSKSTNDQPTTNQQLTTNKKDKKEKNNIPTKVGEGLTTNKKKMHTYQEVDDNGEPIFKRKGLKRPTTEPPYEFSQQTELDRLMASPAIAHNIAGHYILEKKFKFENRDQWLPELSRIVHTAKLLKGYDSRQITKAFDYCKKNWPDIWTLETVSKRIAEANK